MAKTTHQLLLVRGLQIFTGKVPAAYANQKEFFFTSIQNISESLMDLKKETLKDACERFGKKLDEGKANDMAIAEFKDLLEKLVSDLDFGRVCASMVGSKELIKSRLSNLEPISLLGEEMKTSGRDAEAERRINNAYSMLNFDLLIKELAASPSERTADIVLTKARAEVAEYCCLYRIPLKEEDTLTPFSLLQVDAVIAASYRLLSNVRRAMGA